jgi:hypothetical protein
MSESTRAEKAVSAETQKAPMPSATQKTPDPKAADEASPKGEATQQKVEGAEAKLPEGVKERTTEQFEKLQKQLAEERSKRVKAEQVFSKLTPQPTQPVQPTAPTVPDYFNPETGEVDVLKLERQNQTLRQQVGQLNQRVQGIADADQAKQESEAFKAYPELDPNGDKFNQTFHDSVSGLLTNALFKGEKITFKEAAERVAKLSSKEAKKAEKAGAEKALEQLTPKEQAALEATGRSDKRIPSVDLASLQRRTREGDINAIYERIRRVPKK